MRLAHGWTGTGVHLLEHAAPDSLCGVSCVDHFEVTQAVFDLDWLPEVCLECMLMARCCGWFTQPEPVVMLVPERNRILRALAPGTFILDAKLRQTGYTELTQLLERRLAQL